MTNREKIRSMTDAELIENILRRSDTCPPDRDFWDCEFSGSCVDCWKKWLNREAVTES